MPGRLRPTSFAFTEGLGSLKQINDSFGGPSFSSARPRGARIWGEGVTSLHPIATMPKHAGYVKCAACGYKWTWKGREHCFSCSKPMELTTAWRDTAAGGVWENRVHTALAGERNDGWQDWGEWPKSRRTRRNRGGTAEAQQPAAQTPEQLLEALQAAAPHLDPSALEGLKKQLPPPQPVVQLDPNQEYQHQCSLERKAKQALERAVESEAKALAWWEERKEVSLRAAQDAVRAQQAAEAALVVLQKARGQRPAEEAPTAPTSTGATLDLTSLLEGDEVNIVAGPAFELDGLDVEEGDQEAFEALQTKFAKELKQKIAEIFGETAGNLAQCRKEASEMRERLKAKRQRREEAPKEAAVPPKSEHAEAGTPPAGQPPPTGPGAAASSAGASQAPRDGVDVPVDADGPDFGDKVQRLLRAAKGSQQQEL